MIAAVAFLMLGAPSYNLKVYFLNAGQLVKGNDVQIAGTKVGTVQELEITPNGQAAVTIQVDSSDYTPLHEGTRAVIRLTSISGIANRIIELQLPEGGSPEIPDGGSIDVDQTVTQVDIDEVFNTFDPVARVAVQEFFKNQAIQIRGRGEELNEAQRYLNPALSTSARLFRELNRDTPLLARFLQESARLNGAVAERRDDLTEVITRFNTTTRAIGNRRLELQESLERFPDFIRLANTTFVNLRGTLDEVDPLVEASKPAARKLPGFFDELRPLARDARPTLRDLRLTVRRPGTDNDLVELGRTLPPLAHAALDPEERGGERRLGSLPEASKAFRNATPIQAKFKQYVVDFVGWQDDFSHGGNFDGIGAFASSQVYFNLFDFLGNDQVPDVLAEIRALNDRISELESVVDVTAPGGPIPDVAPGGPLANPAEALRQARERRTKLLDDVITPLEDRLGSFNRSTRRKQFERCPGGAEEPAPDGSNVLSDEDQDFINCDEDDRPVGEF